jgi:eukaryotic-like serine/threonine-protein kinase
VLSSHDDKLVSLFRTAEIAPREGDWVGDYQLLRELGRGGEGVVFEARARGIDHHVALKLLSEGRFASAERVHRFVRGAEASAYLQHPHIVPTQHFGTHEGQLFFTMPLFSGGSLADALATRSARRAAGSFTPSLSSWLADAAWMAKVAHAVHHAHQHGTLHRDLKPANILLDERGAPYVTDFGLAKRLDREVSADPSQAVVGTLQYMSPEQARAQPLAVTADIYSLGAILYELLTGSRPFADAAPHELLQRITSSEPIRPPRELVPRLPKHLETVCLKCLHKSALDRYQTALLLAQDLESVCAGRPPSVPPLSRAGRALHWVRRHPQRAARIGRSLFALALLLASITGAWSYSARAQRTALDTNAFIASGQAGAALFQLREYADRVLHAAGEPGVAALATTTEPVFEVPSALTRLHDDFATVFVVSAEGYIQTSWPRPLRDLYSRSYAFRDYFQGVRLLGEQGKRAVYVARAFLSEGDGRLNFGLSAPLFEDGRWVGALVAMVPAASVFGKVRMQDAEGGRVSTLLGPRDVDRSEPHRAREHERFVFLVHDGLRDGEEVAAARVPALNAALQHASAPGAQFSLKYVRPHQEAEYEDPVRGFEGSWLAAFAPVGGTGYVVAVQSPRTDLLEALYRFLARL